MSILQDLVDNNEVIDITQLRRDRELLREIQARLNALGLYPYGPGDPDGIWGANTETGISEFCYRFHLNNYESGLYGPSFATALIHATQVNPPLPSEYGLPTWWQGGTSDDLARAVAREGRNLGMTNRNQWCYVMATIQHETDNRFAPIREYGWRTSPNGDYYGRGYVQITHDYNYQKFGELLNLDLLGDPDLALEPDVSLFIIIYGMQNGSFTGKPLSNYVGDGIVDFYNARRSVNGLDRADRIERYAYNWQNTGVF